MRILAVLLASASTFMLAQALHAEDKPVGKDYVILKVDGEDVKKSEVEAMWKSIFPGGNAPAFESFDPKVKDNVLRGVASEHVILHAAEKAGVENQDDVKARIEAARNQIVIQQFLKDKTKDMVSDDQLKAAYNEKVKSMGGQEEVHARHILVKTEAEAKAIEKKLKKGESFEKIAKEESQDKASGAKGGDLDWFTADKMVPEFSKAAFALKKGEISQPVKTDFGWHIIQVEDIRKSAPPSFDEVKDQLRQEIGNKAVGAYVTDMMKGVKITEVDADGHEKELPAAPPPQDAAPSAGSAGGAAANSDKSSDK